MHVGGFAPGRSARRLGTGVWLTGLPGSGKTAIEAEVFDLAVEAPL